MTKLNLKPNSPELNRILSNKFLFAWYAKMLMEDYELEMNRFKYLAMFTNPEAYQLLEMTNSGKNVVKNSMVVDGQVNAERAKKLNDELNIKLGEIDKEFGVPKKVVDKPSDGVDIL